MFIDRAGVARIAALLLVLGLLGPAGAVPASALPPAALPTQWIAKQYTELLGRAPSGTEWRAWSAYYQGQSSCTADNLQALPRYLAGVATAPAGVNLPATSTEFASLYPAATALDKAARGSTLIRGALNHDVNANDWQTFLVAYLRGGTWQATVSAVYDFALTFLGTARFCDPATADYGFDYSRPIDLRAKVMEVFPALNPPLAPSRTQAELAAALQTAAQATTAAGRVVTLRVGEVVRLGGAPNGNQALAVPAGVVLTTEGTPSYVEPAAGAAPRGLAYHRMGRLVPYTTGAQADGLACVSYFCAATGLVNLATGADLLGVWASGHGLGDVNRNLAVVQTSGSAADLPATAAEEPARVLASRISEPGRDGVGIRANGASTGSPCVAEQIKGNLVTGYGTKHQFDRRGQAQWADGISVHCEEATVAHNSVVDISDLGIAVHGSVSRSATSSPDTVTRQRSVVRHNTVVSAGLDAHAAFAADAVGSCFSKAVAAGGQPPRFGLVIPCLDVFAARDFTGTSLRDNRFFAGTRTSFDVGLMVGGGAQWGDHRIVNQGTGASVTGNSTDGVTTRVNVGVDVHDMVNATVTGNTLTLALADGNPRVTVNKCPQVALLAGAAERSTLTTTASFVTGESSRGCVVGAPPPQGLEPLRVNASGDGFAGAVTGSAFEVWGGDLPYTADISAMVDDFRDVRRMGANVIRLLLDTEDFVNAPACSGCPATVNAAAVDRLGEIVAAAGQVGLYLDITGLGITFRHSGQTWFDQIDGSPAGELLRRQAQETFWRAIAGELKPHNAVAFYDLMNEPTLGAPATTWCFEPALPAAEACWAQNIVKNLTDPHDPARQRSALEAAESWILQMRDAIKVGAGDTRHPVSIGNIFCGGVFAEASKRHLDFYLLHEYPKDATLAQDIANTNGCKASGKPLLIEETYFTASDANLERYFAETAGATAGYLGHFIGGTPSQVDAWLDSHPSTEPGWWPRIIHQAWDQLFLRNLWSRQSVGTGIMPVS